MNNTGYVWRNLTNTQRAELLAHRKQQGLPWHRPPHWADDPSVQYHITAACYEHHPLIGHSRERMESFCATLIEVFIQRSANVHAWCVLPNHYHALIETAVILEVLADLGKMHGRLSFQWNGEELTRGRQVWCGASERFMRNERHFLATLNYIHHNPVHHGYVERWTDWPFSSAIEYLAQTGHEDTARIWRDFPILDYGKGWDDGHL